MTVVDLDAIREARKLAEIIERAFGDEIRRAKSHGCKLMVKLEQEEQLGRGEIGVARVRLVPETNNAKVRMRRAGIAANGEAASSIEARADFADPTDTDSAIKAAIDQAFELARDGGMI